MKECSEYSWREFRFEAHGFLELYGSELYYGIKGIVTVLEFLKVIKFIEIMFMYGVYEAHEFMSCLMDGWNY